MAAKNCAKQRTANTVKDERLDSNPHISRSEVERLNAVPRRIFVE